MHHLRRKGDKNGLLDPSPGLSTKSIEWIRDHDVALVATDTMTFEVYPCEDPGLHAGAHDPPPRHGLIQAQNWYLDELAADCASDGQCDFLLVATPLRSRAPWVPAAPTARSNSTMHETADDLTKLQDLLDRSYAAAGKHLQRIITPSAGSRRRGRRAPHRHVAPSRSRTVTADCRPLVGPVDGVFFRGAFYFGSAPDSMRMRHVRARPQVSATHVPREELSVTVHGRATFVDVKDPANLEFRQTLLEVYVPLYGESWEDFLDSGPVHARIDADRMYTFFLENAGLTPGTYGDGGGRHSPTAIHMCGGAVTVVATAGDVGGLHRVEALDPEPLPVREDLGESPYPNRRRSR
jgi:hypothetical protein